MAMIEARLQGVRARPIRLVRPVNRVRTRLGCERLREAEREKENSQRFCSPALYHCAKKRHEFKSRRFEKISALISNSIR